MNIFILDLDKTKCAQYHVDKHVVSQVKETAQLLSTAVRMTVDPKVLTDCFNHADRLYRATHRNHPCSIWTRQTKQNFLWLCEFGEELCKEYTHRYEKTHKSLAVIRPARFFADHFPDGELTPFAQAIPDKYKQENAVQAYRDCYIGEKSHLFKWKNREEPDWLLEEPTSEGFCVSMWGEPYFSLEDSDSQIEKDGYIFGECEHCHKVKMVEYSADPYIEEIHGEIEESYFCDDCYNECIWDI